MPKIKIEEVKKLAKLSRLEFGDDELAKFVKDFENILEQVNLINKVNTEGVELYEKTLDAKDELRLDEIKQSFKQEEILQNAPQSEDGAFVVPTTVEEGGA